MCLAQAHNAVTPLRLKPTTLQSRVKHSTTEPLRSLQNRMDTSESSMVRVGPYQYVHLCLYTVPVFAWLITTWPASVVC